MGTSASSNTPSPAAGCWSGAAHSYVLEPGQAFLVEVPDDHHYYLPAGWEPWEFVFILFDGADLLRHLHWVIEQHGNLFTLQQNHLVLRELANLCHLLHAQQLTDVEMLAARLYRFVMELRRAVCHPEMSLKPPVARAMHFAARSFAQPIGVEEWRMRPALSRAFHPALHQRAGPQPA